MAISAYVSCASFTSLNSCWVITFFSCQQIRNANVICQAEVFGPQAVVNTQSLQLLQGHHAGQGLTQGFPASVECSSYNRLQCNQIFGRMRQFLVRNQPYNGGIHFWSGPECTR